MIKSRNVDKKSPGRHWTFQVRNYVGNNSGSPTALTTPGDQQFFCIAPADGIIKDFVFAQISAGSTNTGTPTAVATLKKNGTSLLTTAAILSQSSGANKAVDAAGDITLPSGGTRPVFKTDGTCLVSKGDCITINVVETGGTYSTPPIWSAELMISDRSVRQNTPAG